jgi:hypothetical protein
MGSKPKKPPLPSDSEMGLELPFQVCRMVKKIDDTHYLMNVILLHEGGAGKLGRTAPMWKETATRGLLNFATGEDSVVRVEERNAAELNRVAHAMTLTRAWLKAYPGNAWLLSRSAYLVAVQDFLIQWFVKRRRPVPKPRRGRKYGGLRKYQFIWIEVEKRKQANRSKRTDSIFSELEKLGRYGSYESIKSAYYDGCRKPPSED